MPNYRDYQKAMRQGPAYEHGEFQELGPEFADRGSYIVPPFTNSTGPVDERTQMMIEALDYFGEKSRMPNLDPGIEFPDPEGRLRMGGDIGQLDEWSNEGALYDLLQQKRELYPKGDRIREVYNPGMPPDAAQEMMKEILEEYLAGRGQ